MRPCLVIHEKYQKATKWILRMLTLIGIGSSVVAFSSWIMTLLFATGLVLFEQFLERAAFLYTTFYVQPFPNFTYDPDEWVAMGFAFPVCPGPRDLNVVGPVFRTEQYAHSFFELLSNWNYGKQNDTDNNICLSFIIEKSGEYSTYLYPNMDRPSVRQTFAKIGESLKFEKYGKEHQQLVIQFIFCKLFHSNPQSQLNAFIEKQPKDRPFWLRPFVQKPSGSFDILFSEEPLLKHHVKIKHRQELARREVEYQHGKNVMGR